MAATLQMVVVDVGVAAGYPFDGYAYERSHFQLIASDGATVVGAGARERRRARARRWRERTAAGKYLVVWQQAVPGVWKMYLDMFNYVDETAV